MSSGEPRAPIVIDTDVFSAELVPRSRLAELYAPIVTERPAFISFQTVAELRYGALRRSWGFRLNAKIARAEIVHTGPKLVLVYARLRADCALGQRQHNADRWISATAIGLGVPLVSNDTIFRNAPGLEVETLDLP